MEEEHAVSLSKPVKPFDTKFEQWFINTTMPPENSARGGCLAVISVFITGVWQILPLIVPSTKTVLTDIWAIWFGFGLLVSIYAGIRYSYFLLRYKWSWKGRSIFGGSVFLVVAAICIPILILTHR